MPIKVKCNWCDEVFDEEEILCDDEDNEYCPYCKTTGYLMDLE